MKSVISIIVFSTLATGCMVSPVSSNNLDSSYFNQQAMEEKSPMELWMEMRKESEVKEVLEVTLATRMEKLEAAAEAAKKLASKKDNLAKNLKPNSSTKKADKTDVASQ